MSEFARQQDKAVPPGILSGVPEGQDSRVLAVLAHDAAVAGRIHIHVAADDVRLAALQELLAFFAPDVAVIAFSAWDCLPYDRVSPHNEIVARRVAALCGLLDWQAQPRKLPRLLLTTVNAVTQLVMPAAALGKAVLTARRGGALKMDELLAFLQHNGYVRTDTVREPGEFAIRGGIVDLFPPGYEEPLRIDLFGIEIDSIRSFDPVSQRSDKKHSGFSLYPATEFFLDEESIARFRARYREMFGVARQDDPLYEAVSAGRRYNGMDHWLPLFFPALGTLFDYAPGAGLSVDHNGPQILADRMAQIADFYDARRSMAEQTAKNRKSAVAGTIYHPVPPALLYIGESQWQERAASAINFSPFAGPGEGDRGGRRGRDFADVRALPGGDVFAAVADHVRAQGEAGRKVVIAAYSAGSRERLRSLMGSAGLANFVDVAGAEDIRRLGRHDIGMAVLALEHGFVAADLCVVTEQDILGDRLARKSAKRRKAENFLTEISALAPGDLVVHVDHGIGRFEKLETLTAAGKLHDCLKIIYAGDDRLFVPVENIDVLSRFGSGDDSNAQLDRLGGAGWQARKARVRRDLLEMADQLLRIAAARALKKTDAYHVSAELYQEFAAGFPYQETEDQQRSIAAVLEDIGRDHPMDRLVCGDVGFGKTEVAMRAAYVAAMNGAQVAVVVPTTLLARQHYNNFSARFRGMGLRVAQLSRMVSLQEAKKTRENLADGTVNIVIGTHAILGGAVKFANLGLVVVDEEQRFGVKQKERLKDLKANVHVLTLTATPIPRTLQMALSGVREMSLIATPPVDRLAIRTFVLPYDPVVIREALLREHYRGGQSFYVCPRISDIADVEEQLKLLVPEIKFIAAHGQMSAADLEDRMSAFYDGQYGILLATNIIESGIDIPTANTMVVHRADMFGLAQLYQIRGRIGRSKLRAYAYLTYDAGKKLTDQGQKRLEVIETLDTLGSGFALASHDMDIRGAGNLLGEQQSGHVREVGVELYQQMLEEAVAAAREGLDWEKGEGAERWSPQINIGTSVLIPDHYIEDLNVRMSLYRRIADLEDGQEIEGFAAELIDRFGPIPEEVENLLNIMAIKQLCRRAGIASVEAGPKGAVFGFHKDSPPNLPALMKWLQEKSGGVKLRPDQKIVAIRQWISPAQRVKGVQSLMKELASLAPM